MRDLVLVIDDDPDFRDLVSLCVGDWGLTCISATTCTEALALVEPVRDRIRVVLLDYFMPGLTPCACATELRTRLGAGVPVVLVSAGVDIGERAAEMGLDRYLPKPFEMTALEELVVAGG